MTRISKSGPSPEYNGPRWNPIQTFALRESKEGYFYCAGVTKEQPETKGQPGKPSRPCNYKREGSVAKAIYDQVTDIEKAGLANCSSRLRKLAELTLCHHHQAQVEVKIRDWDNSIRDSQVYTSTSTRISLVPATITPSPSPPSERKGFSLSRLNLRRNSKASSSASFLQEESDQQAEIIRSQDQEIARLRARLADFGVYEKDEGDVVYELGPLQTQKQ